MGYKILAQHRLKLAASLKHASGAVVSIILSSIITLGTAMCLTVMSVNAQESDTRYSGTRPLVSIKELMEKTITPATNTIWSAFDPPTTDEQWITLEEAAVTMLIAANVNALGGTGPMDNEWVKQAAWKGFNQKMIDAALDVLEAIRGRDHEALLRASDILYPPCADCHRQFNPGVVNRE